MKLAVLAKQTEKLLIDNSPALLTAVGVVGTVTTAYLTGTATYSAVLSELEDWPGYPMEDYVHGHPSAKERVKRHWKLYIPAMGSGLLTISAVVSANRIGSRRAAGIAAAYTLSEKVYSEYRDKVVDTLGVKKEQALRDELAQDRVARTPGSTEIIVMGTEVLCLDTYSGRYFKSSKEDLKAAENEVNGHVINNSYASLTDLYFLIGLPKTSVSDEVGWNTDQLLKMEFSVALSEDNRPCLAVSYNINSTRDYWRNH